MAFPCKGVFLASLTASGAAGRFLQLLIPKPYKCTALDSLQSNFGHRTGSISVHTCPGALFSFSLPPQGSHRSQISPALSGARGIEAQFYTSACYYSFLLPIHPVLIVCCSLELFLAFVFSHECIEYHGNQIIFSCIRIPF